jgi:hypothetical protein
VWRFLFFLLGVGRFIQRNIAAIQCIARDRASHIASLRTARRVAITAMYLWIRRLPRIILAHWVMDLMAVLYTLKF